MVAENRAKRRASSPQAYVTVWATLGTVAFAYLTASTVTPELVGEVIPIAQRDTDDRAKHLVAEVDSMRREVDRLRQELASARTESQRTVTAEVVPPPPALPPLVLPPPPAVAGNPEPVAPAQGLSPRILAKAAERAPKAAPAPAKVAEAEGWKPAVPQQTAVVPQAPVLLNASPSDDQQSGIVTGSVTTDEDKPRPAPVPPKPPAVKGPVGIEVGSADSIEALRLNWSIMNDQNSAVLGKLSPRYKLNTTGKGEPLALVAGPIATPEEATRICGALKARGVTCKISGYGGERL